MEKVLEKQVIEDISIFKFINVKRFNIILTDQVKNEIINCIKSGCKKVIFDLEDITFIDSSGFGTLVAIYSYAKENQAKFKLCNISKEAMDLVIVTKLDHVFEIFTSLDQSIKSF